MTPRWEKEHGDYSVFDFREELEYEYLTIDQAQKAIFPGKSFTAAPVKLTGAPDPLLEPRKHRRSASKIDIKNS